MTNNEVDALAEVLSDYIKCGRCPVCDEGFCDGVDHGIENCKNAFVIWIWDTLGETYPDQDKSEERKSIFMNDYLKLMDRIYSAAFDDGYKANKSNSYNEAYDKGFEDGKAEVHEYYDEFIEMTGV